MRFSPKRGLEWKTAVVVCALKIISIFGLQNEIAGTSVLPLSVSNSNSSFTSIHQNAKNVKDVSLMTSNTIGNAIATASKTFKRNRRRKNKSSKKRRKGIIPPTMSPLESLPENHLNTTTINAIKKKRKRKYRRRKNRKYRRKQKPENNNILEVTTAKGMVYTTNANSNSTINELIRKLNQNPEDNFEDFQLKHGNKTLASARRSSGQSVENLVAPMPASAHFPIPLNDNITLHVSVSNTTNHRSYPRKYNRCRKNKGGCAHYCNPRGKIKCSCIKGFSLAKDQKTCFDIDECKINNGGCAMKCINTLGSFECRCSTGLRLTDDLKFCEDVNECLLRNGHGPCQDTCDNSYGSYRCSCARLNGTTLSEDGHSCVDLNECAKENGGCSHKCINTVGRAFCACPDGMVLSSDWKTCQDINECEDDAIQRSCKNGCINTEGSYHCVDLSEYQRDQEPAKTVCKALFPPTKGFIMCSRNGATRSYSKTGRRRIMNSPGTTCKLGCPVGYRMVGQFYVTCGFGGQWEGKQEAKCIRTPPPILECPTTQTFKADQESNLALVEFPSPITNINWKYVKSYPSWAKDLTGTLKEGRHDIHFTVQDPSTKLTASCSFKIIIEN